MRRRRAHKPTPYTRKLLKSAIIIWFVIVVTSCLASMLVRYIRKAHFKFCSTVWTGLVATKRVQKCRYHVVVSHCKHKLSWIEAELRQVSCEQRSFTVYSKCGMQVIGAPKTARIVRLNNVGRCDHTYAYHLATGPKPNVISEDVILFMKDTTEIHQPAQRVPFQNMLKVALGSNRFACGQKPFAGADSKFRGISIWHNATVLSRFNLVRHTHNSYNKSQKDENSFHIGLNLGEWLDRFLGVKLHHDIVPVCYGGVFATSTSQIRRHSRGFWLRASQSLSRGDNIEEGHFMERSWAHLFLEPAAIRSQQKHILKRALGTIQREYNGLLGTLYGCTCS